MAEPSRRLSILRAVRRWLVLFLLVLLPLQMSWAAVAGYCAHTAATDAAHFGHHGHEDHPHANQAQSSAKPEAAADAAAKPGGKASSDKALDADCGHCHSHCLGALLMPGPAEPAALGRSFQAAADEAAHAQPPVPPERPQWAPLA